MHSASSEVVDFCRECNPVDFESFMERCEQLRVLLEETNRHVNLTAINTPEMYWSKHVADSLALGKYFPAWLERPVHLADIGCGAGFPSLVLALAYPSWQITAIDSIGKKTAFVRTAVKELKLKNVNVITARSCEMAHKKEWEWEFEIITARAVSVATKLVRENLPMLRPGGSFILYKTPTQVAEDLPEVNQEAAAVNLTWKTTPVFALPAEAGSRQFLYSEQVQED